MNDDLRYAVLARKQLANGRARWLRRQLGYSQRQMAQAVGVSDVCILSWELGHWNPHYEHAVALGRELAQMDELFLAAAEAEDDVSNCMV